ncbi:MAG: bestrophin family ion channel [Cytophagaceae bacterium]
MVRLEYIKLWFQFKKNLVNRLGPGFLLISVISAALIVLHTSSTIYHDFNMKISAALPGYMGAALGLLLVFRNNTAYDKWWEARKEVGSLVNTSRNVALTINALLPENSPIRQEFGQLIIAFVYSLKAHLRDQKDDECLQELPEKYRSMIQKAQHRPNIICNIMMHKIELLQEQKVISDIQQSVLIEKIQLLIDILGKCERIKNTPIPMAYMILLKFFINIYVIILPFTLVDDIGWFAIPIIWLLYYLLMSIVITAEEIDEPFGNDLNDLAMDKISNNIRLNVIEIIST